MRLSPSVSSTTFSRNFSIASSRSCRSRLSAAVPASCTSGGVHESVVLIILPITSAISADGDREAEPPAAHAVGLAERERGDRLLEHAGLLSKRAVLALPDHVAVGLVAEDRRRSLPRTRSAMSLQVLLRRDAAGRVVRRIEKDRPRRRRPRREIARCSCDVRPKLVRLLAAARAPARAPRRSMFGMYVGKYGLKTSTPSPGFRNASQKNCSKTFAPGPDDDVLRLGRDVELGADELARRPRGTPAAPATGNSATGCSWIASMPAACARRGAVERAVADFQLDDVLARGLQRSWRRRAR